jgi:hypothetical protein
VAVVGFAAAAAAAVFALRAAEAQDARLAVPRVSVPALEREPDVRQAAQPVAQDARLVKVAALAGRSDALQGDPQGGRPDDYSAVRSADDH